MFIGGIRLPFPGLGGWIREDALPLGELLADIRHQTPSVAQGELVGHVVVDEVVVAFNLSHWSSMEFNGVQWISMEFNGVQWISMDFNGFKMI